MANIDRIEDVKKLDFITSGCEIQEHAVTVAKFKNTWSLLRNIRTHCPWKDVVITRKISSLLDKETKTNKCTTGFLMYIVNARSPKLNVPLL